MNLSIIFLTLHQNCIFLATHVGGKVKSRIFAIFNRCTSAWRAGKFDSESHLIVRKVKSNKLVHLRSLYPNMVVFGLELFIFWSWFRHRTYKYRFPKYSKIFVCFFLLNGWQLAKWKRVFLTCPCHEIYRDEAVGLKSCKNTWKITIFVKMWNLGQYRENLIFCQ